MASERKYRLTPPGVGGRVPAVQVRFLRRRLTQYPASGPGPSGEKRQQSWFPGRFRRRQANDEVMHKVPDGDPGCTETARIQPETAVGIAPERDLPPRTGVITPVMAVEGHLIERLSEAGPRFQRLA